MSREVVLKRKWDGLVYEHIVSGKNRGEVRIKLRSKTIKVPCFPHIKRIFVLEKGFKHFKEGRAWVEEKIDGYNVRAVFINGKIYGFTRGGHLCPFTTEKLRDNEALVELLENNPNIIVNGEMAGPHNPYITQYPPYVEEDVKFFVFDIMRDGRFLSVDERLELIREYNLESVRSFGFLDLEETRKVVKKHYREIEGIVLKSSDRKVALKYVFPDSDIDDVKVTARIFPEVNAGYFLQRIVRSAIFLNEQKVSKKRYYEMLGKAFLDSFSELVNSVLDGEEVYEDFTIIVNNPKTAYDLVELLSGSKSVKIDVANIDMKKGKYWVTIRKIYPKATKFWRERLHGKAFVD